MARNLALDIPLETICLFKNVLVVTYEEGLPLYDESDSFAATKGQTTAVRQSWDL
jgi:hypothetical protein